MADIHIERTHSMSLAQARQVAADWMAQAQDKFDLSCEHETGELRDQVQFSRPGMTGTLAITADKLEVEAELGFLLSAFKEKIEGEITKQIDRLLAAQANRAT